MLLSQLSMLAGMLSYACKLSSVTHQGMVLTVKGQEA